MKLVIMNCTVGSHIKCISRTTRLEATLKAKEVMNDTIKLLGSRKRRTVGLSGLSTEIFSSLPFSFVRKASIESMERIWV